MTWLGYYRGLHAQDDSGWADEDRWWRWQYKRSIEPKPVDTPPEK